MRFSYFPSNFFRNSKLSVSVLLYMFPCFLFISIQQSKKQKASIEIENLRSGIYRSNKRKSCRIICFNRERTVRVNDSMTNRASRWKLNGQLSTTVNPSILFGLNDFYLLILGHVYLVKKEDRLRGSRPRLAKERSRSTMTVLFYCETFISHARLLISFKIAYFKAITFLSRFLFLPSRLKEFFHTVEFQLLNWSWHKILMIDKMLNASLKVSFTML